MLNVLVTDTNDRVTKREDKSNIDDGEPIIWTMTGNKKNKWDWKFIDQDRSYSTPLHLYPTERTE